MPPGRLRRYLDIPSTMINNIFGISIIDGTFEVSQAAITVINIFQECESVITGNMAIPMR